MQEAVPVGTGAMAAILGLDAPAVERACREAAHGEVVTPANLNGPDQIVIAGHATAVARASAAARAAGAKRAVELPVSAPFHCPLMEPAAARLALELARIEMGEPRIPVYANVDARPVRTAARARELLVQQVTAAVRWESLVLAMVDHGFSTFVEIGPGKVLSGLVRRIHKDARVLAAGDPQGVENVVRELGSAS
jgi:[acyl-carrier-protein] S-malonyltransferase